MSAHLLDSFAMNCENSSGLLDDGSSPLAFILLINAGSVSACRVALFKDVTTLFGIFLGPNNPTQTVTSKFGKLDSAMVGILAKIDGLLLPEVANAFNCPPLINGIAFEILVMVYKDSLEATETTELGPPLKPIWVALDPTD